LVEGWKVAATKTGYGNEEQLQAEGILCLQPVFLPQPVCMTRRA
jgi:hypothetical protein